MNKENALQVLKQVCEAYRGTLQEHNALQEALKVVSELEEKRVEEKPAE